MSRVALPPPPRAEQASRLVSQTLAQHRRQEAYLSLSPVRAVGRLSAWSAGPDAAQVRRQATLVRIASVVESFVTNELVLRLEPEAPPPRTMIMEHIYSKAEDDAIGSWPNMEDRYRRWFGIRPTQTSCPGWREFEAVKDARNAIAHGLGAVTRRLARRDLPQIKREWAAIDIHVVGNAVVLSELSLKESAQAARDVIGWFGRELVSYDGRAAAP